VKEKLMIELSNTVSKSNGKYDFFNPGISFLSK